MSSKSGPLEGVRVVDATTGIAGPLATMILADFGADVLRVEVGVGGEVASPLPGEVMWHRNKTVVVVGDDPAGLLDDVDLVVTSDDAEARRLGVAVDGPQPGALVHLHLPAWRPPAGEVVDPMLADRMVQARYGVARRQTSFGGGPVECVYPFVSYLQGAWGATVSIAALVERVQRGIGQRVVVDALHGAIVAATTTMFADPKTPLPNTAVGPGGPNPAFGTYECADGEWIFLGALGVKFQDIAFEVLGTTDVTAHPRIAANREEIYAVDLRNQVRARIAEGFRAQSRAHWLDGLGRAGCPVSPVGRRDEWLDHPQVVAMGQRVTIDDPQVGRVVMGGIPVDFSESPCPDVLARRYADHVTWPDRPRPVVSASGDVGEALPGRGPLDGVRVLDLGTVLAGPYAGQLLASLGADVIKVETTKGDEFRTRGHMVNRGQRSVSVDLRDERGHDAFMWLAASSHVVLDNFRPGVSTRLKVDLDSLRTVNPGVIATSITGFGGIGPMGDHPGYDPVVQALSGIMQAQGGDAEPVFCTVSVNDVTSACLAALGTCAALYHHAVGRGGQAVGTSLAAAAVFMQGNELVRYDGRRPAETGGRDYPGPQPTSRYYRCADGWARLHLPSADAAARAGLVAHPGLDTRALAYAIAFSVAGMSVAELADAVTPYGGVVERARDNKEVLVDPNGVEDGHLGVVRWPDGNQTHLPRAYATFGRRGVPPMMTTPGMGEHTREVLLEAGLDEAAVEELARRGIVTQGEPMHTVAGTGYR
ncbi:hypothetical protein MMAD_55090 (plasmid) [Mycolicibacterium madagascariense]|uniref:CoA transferase n=1 Tax=Mycolicibacterium madagascariense TaxID=212765 RepID=A0A7I7XQ00_9MYCO|nr:CoA transferase [Mycolicibacterium madagascariense]BBZ31214.1 hypothetical protein MMAD_55090 [Mycolicibacterium madagascariense]